MKSIVILSALLASSSVFASPLSSIKAAVVTPVISLVTYSEDSPLTNSLTAFYSTNSGISCTLDFNQKAQSSNLHVVGTEPKQQGYVYSFAPSSDIALQVVSQKSEVTQAKGWCNGEPELCDNTNYNQALETLQMVDASANEYTLRCYGQSVPAPGRPTALQTSDVQMPGLTLQ